MEHSAPVAPADGRFTDTSVSTTSTDEIALSGYSPRSVFCVACSVAFNITFGDDDHTEPAAAYMFAAGQVHQFRVPPSATHFRLRATGAGTAKHWKGSYE